MARQKNVEKLASAIGGSVGSFSDGSGSWVEIEDEKVVTEFTED